MTETDQHPKPSAAARRGGNGDLLLGLAVVAFGGFVVFEAARMPYWEPDMYMMSPGIVPALVGGVLVLMGLVYTLQAILAGGWKGWTVWWQGIVADPENRRLGVLVALMLVYTVGLVGRVPFFVATLFFHGALFGYLRIGAWWKWGTYTLGATLVVAVGLPKLFEMPLPGAE